VRIEYRNRGSHRWHRLKSAHTNGRGYWSARTRYRRGRRYRARWRHYAGPPTRVYAH
jgi:hypothetical protein